MKYIKINNIDILIQNRCNNNLFTCDFTHKIKILIECPNKIPPSDSDNHFEPVRQPLSLSPPPHMPFRIKLPYVVYYGRNQQTFIQYDYNWLNPVQSQRLGVAMR